jgi:lysozyme
MRPFQRTETNVPRTVNQTGLTLIKRFEGLKLDAYLDVAGNWTIGYGHTRGVHAGMYLSEAEAQQVLEGDLRGVEAAVGAAVAGSPTNDNQFSAMVALCFNIGAANFRASTVLREHCLGQTQQAADGFLMWNKARINNVLQPVAGLSNRRDAERALYMTSPARDLARMERQPVT